MAGIFKIIGIFFTITLVASHENSTEKDDEFTIGHGSYLVHMESLYKISRETNSNLKKLKTINQNSQLEKECSSRTFDFIIYYRIVYLKYCSNEQADFKNFCGKLENYSSGTSDTKHVQEIGFELKIFKTEAAGINDIHEATQACRNVLGFTNVNKSEEIGTQYTEWIVSSLPFCRPFTTGISKLEYDEMILNGTIYSALSITSLQCKAALYTTNVLDALIAFLIIVANMTILAVIATSAQLRNIPGMYKSSLAVADLLIGVLVLPGCIYNTWKLYSCTLPFRVDGQAPSPLDYFSQTYLNTMGFFTILSFSASVFSLLGMTIDRLIAIKYRARCMSVNNAHRNVKNIAAIVFLWATAVFLSLYPIIDQDSSTDYTISALNLVLSTGLVAQVLYAVLLGVSLVILWALNISIYCSLKISNNEIHHTPLNRKMVGNERKSSASAERNLARTIIVIVAAFTAAIVPSVFSILAIMSPHVHMRSNPEQYSPEAYEALTGFEYIATRLFMSNSFWNCIIYNVRDKKFREALLQLFRRSKQSAKDLEVTDSTVVAIPSVNLHLESSSVTSH